MLVRVVETGIKEDEASFGKMLVGLVVDSRMHQRHIVVTIVGIRIKNKYPQLYITIYFFSSLLISFKNRIKTMYGSKR